MVKRTNAMGKDLDYCYQNVRYSNYYRYCIQVLISSTSLLKVTAWIGTCVMFFLGLVYIVILIVYCMRTSKHKTLETFQPLATEPPQHLAAPTDYPENKPADYPEYKTTDYPEYKPTD